MAEKNAPKTLDVRLQRWSIHQRANIQLTMLALYEYAEHMQPPPEKDDYLRVPPPQTVLFDHLIGAAFSLWRAVFLTEKPRSPLSVQAAQKEFLRKVISTNAIGFTDDLNSSAWAVTFYLENAALRIVAAREYARTRFPNAELPDWLVHTQELMNGTVVNALYEWEMLHAAVRALFKLINPGSPLQIHKPDLIRWSPEDVSARANSS